MIDKSAFERKSIAYDRFVGRWSPGFAPYILDRAGILPGKRILDVGSGTGAVALAAAAAVGALGKVIGIDIAENMIEGARDKAARLKLDNIEFLLMDADQMEFTDNSFDTVVSLLSAMYFPNLEQALREQYRVLVPGGRIVSVSWGTMAEVPFAGILWEAVARHISGSEEEAVIGFKHGDDAVLPETFRVAGFRGIEDSRISIPTRYQSFDEYWDSVFSGGGRATRFLKAQPAETIETIRIEVLEAFEPYRDGGGYALTATARFISAYR